MNYHILLGSNKEEMLSTIEQAKRMLSEKKHRILSQSSFYKTEPWGEKQQPDFLNQVIIIQTDTTPFLLLEQLQEIEKLLGRTRNEENRWAERTIDIDILYAENTILKTETLTIPHPLIHLRNFTLIPLVEIDPFFIHPLLKRNQQQLLHSSPDKCTVIQHTNLS